MAATEREAVNLLRVFPRRTSYTPTDALAVVGAPGLFEPPPFDEIAVSCTFTWDKAEARRLRDAWQARYPKAIVRVGGPAYDSWGHNFEPGKPLQEEKSLSVFRSAARGPAAPTADR